MFFHSGLYKKQTLTKNTKFGAGSFPITLTVSIAFHSAQLRFFKLIKLGGQAF